GDPTLYERYWKEVAGDKATIVIPGWQTLSYFSNLRNLCWFMEPELEAQIIRLHRVVGNAVTEGRHLVVGTGVTQLFQAALHALSHESQSQDDRPLSVVAATPYYSFYKNAVEYMQSRLYKWAGHVSSFNGEGPYVEVVTSPNNPDGFMRKPVIKNQSGGGAIVYDFAYYWPQYTPITSPADHDIMLFTASKITGHAGMRIGWALVKNKEVAERMTQFVVMSSIGVSKDSQLRGAKLLEVVSDGAETAAVSENGDTLFEFGHQVMAERWRRLREVVKKNGLFSIPEFPSAFCNYFKKSFKAQPAFAWLKCEGDVEDCEGLFKENNILIRGGRHFGVNSRFVRISMLDRDENFKLFIKRLAQIHH
ncbi:hypothetical protein V2J09_015011, partial [Rumex salicifolius]